MLGRALACAWAGPRAHAPPSHGGPDELRPGLPCGRPTPHAQPRRLDRERTGDGAISHSNAAQAVNSQCLARAAPGSLLRTLRPHEPARMPRWALAALAVLVVLGGARLLQGTAAGGSLNARLYSVAHLCAQARRPCAPIDCTCKAVLGDLLGAAR